MGNLQSAHALRRNTPLLHLLRLLGPSFAVGEGGGGGGSSTSNPPTQNEVFNPYKRRQDEPQPSDVASNREEGGGTKSFDGRSKSTKKGHKGAKKKWNAFAEINKLPQFDALSKKDVCGMVYANNTLAQPNNPPILQLLERFAQFLTDYRKSSTEEEDDDYDDEKDEVGVLFASTGQKEYNGLAPGTILGHFTRIKSLLFSKFKALGAQGDMPEWYAKLHRTLKNRVVSDCIARGGVVSKKTVGIGRKALANMCDFFFAQSSALGYEKRCVLAVVWAAVGRGGEIAFTQWDGVRWNVDQEHLVMDWGEVKKGVQYLMTFHPDATDWRIDVLHAIACYVLCQDGGFKASATPEESGVNWIFPNYADMAEGGAATKLSRAIEEAKAAGVEYLLPTSTSHGLRVGSSDEMVYHHMLDIFSIISRGGWDCKADSMLFHYLTADATISHAGKALANWHNPKMPVSAPTLNAIITPANKAQVEAFCCELFGTSSIPNTSTEMKELRNVLVASLLRFYDDVLRVDRNCLVIQKMRAAAIRAGGNGVDLKSWGQLVKDAFVTANAQNFGNCGGTESEQLSAALTVLQKSSVQTSENIRAMSSQLTQVQAKQVETNRVVETLVQTNAMILKNQEEILKNQEYMMAWMETANHIVPDEHSPLKRKAPPAPTFTTEDSSASKKAKTAPVDVNEKLSETKVEIDWRICGEKGPAEFVKDVLTERIDVAGKHFIPASPSDTKTVKNRLRALRWKGKTVFEHLVKYVSDDDKVYFDWRRLPPLSEREERDKWLNKMMDVVGKAALLLVKTNVFEYLHAKDEYTEKKFKSKFGNTQMKISALGGLISDRNTAVKKKNDRNTAVMMKKK